MAESSSRSAVILTADYPPIEGGISTVALNVTRELAAAGWKVTVVAPHFPGMEEFDRAEPAQVVRFRGYGLGPLRVVPMAIRS
ncbi:MAG: glycosyltransferase, partial [Candidatus Hydrogenedentes bacterium]|nr:glycosyltransferase [Candidatus Hydrogenedentota bacterium]